VKKQSVLILLFVFALTSCFRQSSPKTETTKPQSLPQRIDSAMVSSGQEAIAECMKETGFRYFKRAIDSQATPVPPLGEPERLEDGYGAAKMVTFNNANRRKDPNASYIASLNEGDRAAYSQVFEGETGCSKRGMDASQALLTTVLQKITVARDQFNSDRSVIAYRDDWRNCMKRDGYPDLTRSDLVVRLLNTYNEDPQRLAQEERTAVRVDTRCIPSDREEALQRTADLYLAKVKL
jgi:hypothetical protein